MFEQSILGSPKSARKPYSVVLSLLLQILALGVLCLLPFVSTPSLSTSSLPSMQLKSLVLAAPPKPPSVLAKEAPGTHTAAVTPRMFRIVPLPLQVKPANAFTTNARTPAPEVAGVEMSSGDAGQIPGGMAGSILTEPPPAPKPQPGKLVRMGSLMEANLVHIVRPVYPPLARASRIQGAVEFTATISKQGAIENLTLLHGHPLLVNAAKEAVLQWRYRPTLLNGEAVEVITDIVVNFTLNP